MILNLSQVQYRQYNVLFACWKESKSAAVLNGTEDCKLACAETMLHLSVYLWSCWTLTLSCSPTSSPSSLQIRLSLFQACSPTTFPSTASTCRDPSHTWLKCSLLAVKAWKWLQVSEWRRSTPAQSERTFSLVGHMKLLRVVSHDEAALCSRS